VFALVNSPATVLDGMTIAGSVTDAGSFGGKLTTDTTTAITSLNVTGSVLPGAVIAAGQFGAISVGGDFEGMPTAEPDPNVPGSATIGTLTVGGSFTSTGSVFADEAYTTTPTPTPVAGTGSGVGSMVYRLL
jgi:hypothetical protein